MTTNGKIADILESLIAASKAEEPPLLSPLVQQLGGLIGLIASSSQDHVVICDPGGRCLHVSPSVEHALHRRGAELYGRTWRELGLPRDLLEPVEARVDQAFMTSQRVIGEVNLRSKGGERCLEYILDPFHDTTSDIWVLVAVIRDITQRKQRQQLEARLQKSRQLFRVSVDNMLDAFCIYSTLRTDKGEIVDFFIDYVNEAACVSNRLSRDEQVGKRMFEIWPRQQVMELFVMFCQVVESGKPLSREVLLYETRDQQNFSRALDIRLIRMDDGLTAVWRDVTERRRAEETLKASERRFRSVFDNALDAMLVVDAAGCCMDANPAACELFDTRKAALVGQQVPVLRDPQRGGAQEIAEVWQRLRTQRQGRGELSFLGKDGQERALEFGAAADIEPRRHLLVLRDITARKRAEAARRDLLAIVSHDLKNPLSNILMANTVLLRNLPPGEPGERPRQQAERIQRLAQRMNQLVRDLLDASRIEASHLSMEWQMPEATALIRESLDLLAPEAQEKSIRVESEIIGEPLIVLGDPGRLLQVISNLIGNAIKYTPAGGQIQVRAEPSEQEVYFSVADSGPGIPESDLAHIFDRYWQGRQADRDGSGLGLYIAKGIVEAHGGRIWVKSRAGAGSTFFFSLPLVMG